MDTTSNTNFLSFFRTSKQRIPTHKKSIDQLRVDHLNNIIYNCSEVQIEFTSTTTSTNHNFNEREMLLTCGYDLQTKCESINDVESESHYSIDTQQCDACTNTTQVE